MVPLPWSWNKCLEISSWSSTHEGLLIVDMDHKRIKQGQIMFGFLILSFFFEIMQSRKVKKCQLTQKRRSTCPIFLSAKDFFRNNFVFFLSFFLDRMKWRRKKTLYFLYTWLLEMTMNTCESIRLLVGLTAATKLIDDGSRRILSHPTLTLSFPLSHVPVSLLLSLSSTQNTSSIAF